MVWCDNLGARALAANPVFHVQTKHIEIDVHYVRDQVLQGLLEIRYVPSNEQIAECLTKYLTHSQFFYLRNKLELVPQPSRLKGGIKDKNQLESNQIDDLSPIGS